MRSMENKIIHTHTHAHTEEASNRVTELQKLESDMQMKLRVIFSGNTLSLSLSLSVFLPVSLNVTRPSARPQLCPGEASLTPAHGPLRPSQRSDR